MQKRRKRTYPPVIPAGAKKRPLAKLLGQARKVVKKIMDDQKAACFLSPIDEVANTAPGYHAVVKQPMDLGSIVTYLDYDMYNTVTEVKADAQQVWDNCRLYNGKAAWGTYNNLLLLYSDILREQFEAEWAKELVHPKGVPTSGERWLSERREFQDQLAAISPHEVHTVLSYLSAGCPAACPTRSIGQAAVRFNIDLLLIPDAPLHACLRYISNIPKSSRPVTPQVLLAWSRDADDDVNYDDAHFY